MGQPPRQTLRQGGDWGVTQREALAIAERLAARLRAGEPLLPRSTAVALATGERAYAETWAIASRFCAAEVTYERRWVIAGGGVLGPVTLLASALGNRKHRVAAERAAAPQWRPVGEVGVTVTDRRLVIHGVEHRDGIAYEEIVALHPEPPDGLVDIELAGASPWRLRGPGMPALAVLLEHLLTPRFGSRSA